MAKIKLTIDSNFAEVGKDMKKFGALTEAEAKRIQKFQDKFKSKAVDDFIQKNKRASLAVKALHGSIKGNIAEQKGLERQIKSLIAKGLNPNDKAVLKLKNRLIALKRAEDKETRASKRNAEAKAIQAKSTRLAGRAFAVFGLAVAGSTALMVKDTFAIAKLGDEYAKTSRRLDITAEALQELTFVADRQGVSAQEVTKALEKMQRAIGDARGNSGKLQQILKYTNPELLEMFKNASSMEEAFNLAVVSIENMKDQFDKASLATALFGKSGLKMLTVTEAGTEGIKKLREEARSYGLISNKQAEQAEAFIDAQTNMNKAWNGLRFTLGAELMPVLEKFMINMKDLFMNTEGIKKTFKTLIPTVLAFGTALASYFVLSKIIAMVTGLSKAFMILNAVLLSNPIGLIALGIGSLVALIAYVYRKWDDLVTAFKIASETIYKNLSIVWLQIEKNYYVMIEHMKAGFEGFVNYMTKAFLDLLDVLASPLAKIPGFEKAYNNLSVGIQILTQQINSSNKEIVKSVDSVSKKYDEKINNVISASEKEIKTIAFTAKAQKDLMNNYETELNKHNKKIQDATSKHLEKINKLKNQFDITNITKKSKADPMSIFSKQTNSNNTLKPLATSPTASTFSPIDFGDQLATEAENNNKKLEALSIYEQSRIDILQKYKDLELSMEADKYAQKQRLQDEMLSGTAKLSGALADLIDSSGAKSKEALIFQKALASAEAGINSYLAYTKAMITDPSPFPLNLINAGIVLASGLAQQAKIWSTPIPSAETGGTFDIPDRGGSVDNVPIAMGNGGEKVKIIPRSQEDKTKNIIMLDGQTLATWITDNIRQNKIEVQGNF